MTDAIDLDPFARFRKVTRARIGLGRAGDALPTRAVLDFQLAHARARDAVHGHVDFAGLAARLQPLPVLRLASRARDRSTYLARPDLGRRVAEADLAALPPPAGCDVAFVIADGLSAAAIERQAEPVLRAALRRLGDLVIGPVILGEQARVAFGDEAGAAVGARVVVVLIGERPGLSVPDSLGVYITYDPRVGRRDSERNCISNCHADGLSAEAAADKIAWLVRAALERGLTGVELKDETTTAPVLAAPASE